VEQKNNQDFAAAGLCKCPHCGCCFCNQTDLNQHLNLFGDNPADHAAKFRNVHGRMEHGSVNGPE
jgi:uncharacterized C2H2 Zn-finger protein